LTTAAQKTPDDLTVRIVLAFTSQNLPPQALGAIGVKNPVDNLRFIGKALDNSSSDFAPHAAVVMNAFIGEGLLMSGDKENSRASFERALKQSQPDDPGQLAGRKMLDSTIAARMNGGTRPIFENPIFSGCHSCHLAAPDKLLSTR